MLELYDGGAALELGDGDGEQRYNLWAGRRVGGATLQDQQAWQGEVWHVGEGRGPTWLCGAASQQAAGMLSGEEFWFAPHTELRTPIPKQSVFDFPRHRSVRHF